MLPGGGLVILRADSPVGSGRYMTFGIAAITVLGVATATATAAPTTAPTARRLER
ncbi:MULTISPECIES: hypothetical protein [unclassified Kitasatospora]|uniref:hypothetical protein n=1 Tax=unclassified Kitasatospora TaxID=2633591 RepID=UPI0034001F18